MIGIGQGLQCGISKEKIESREHTCELFELNTNIIYQMKKPKGYIVLFKHNPTQELDEIYLNSMMIASISTAKDLTCDKYYTRVTMMDGFTYNVEQTVQEVFDLINDSTKIIL
jgi:uncharacterized protein YlzI (FlbEa/FlbD family)